MQTVDANYSICRKVIFLDDFPITLPIAIDTRGELLWGHWPGGRALGDERVFCVWQR
jgi:hypothetical protein